MPRFQLAMPVWENNTRCQPVADCDVHVSMMALFHLKERRSFPERGRVLRVGRSPGIGLFVQRSIAGL